MSQLSNKDEILKAAQKDTYVGKEFENRIGTMGTMLASILSLIVGTILFLTEYFVKRTWNFGLFAVTMTASSVQLLYEGSKVKTVWKIVVGSIGVIVALIFVFCFIRQVIA